MINKLRSCALMLFIAVCSLVFTTVTIASEDINTEYFSINACLYTSSRTVLKSPPVGSGDHLEGALMFAQSNSSCPCFSLSKLMSTKWDRCIMASLGFPRMLRRLVGNPPNHEIWTINLNKLRASCECQGTPAGLCTGKGERGSEIYHEGMANSEWMTCTDIIKTVAEVQGLTCE
jgi:hypothetical protein